MWRRRSQLRRANCENVRSANGETTAAPLSHFALHLFALRTSHFCFSPFALSLPPFPALFPPFAHCLTHGDYLSDVICGVIDHQEHFAKKGLTVTVRDRSRQASVAVANKAG